MFFAVFSYLIYIIISRFFPDSIDGEFTMIFICLVGFIITFVKIYIINNYYEAILNKQKKSNIGLLISTYIIFTLFYSSLIFQLTRGFYRFTEVIPVNVLGAFISLIKVYAINKYLQADLNSKPKSKRL